MKKTKWIPIVDITKHTKVPTGTIRKHICQGVCPSKKVDGKVCIPEDKAKEYLKAKYSAMELRTVKELAEACGKPRNAFYPDRYPRLMKDIVIKIWRFYYVTQEDFDRIVWINNNTVSTQEAADHFGLTKSCIYKYTKKGLPYYQFGQWRKVTICQVRRFMYKERLKKLGHDINSLKAFKLDIDDEWKKYAIIEE